MAYCVCEDNKTLFADVFCIGKAKDPLAVLITALVQKLKQLQENHQGVNRILLEQQLGRSATKNFALSSVLYSYFIDHIPGAVVEFVNPRRKFKILSTMEGVPGITDRSEDFKTTRGPALKKLAVEACKALALHHNDVVLLQKLQQLKKLDDISDAALYAMLC